MSLKCFFPLPSLSMQAVGTQKPPGPASFSFEEKQQSCARRSGFIIPASSKNRPFAAFRTPGNPEKVPKGKERGLRKAPAGSFFFFSKISFFRLLSHPNFHGGFRHCKLIRTRPSPFWGFSFLQVVSIHPSFPSVLYRSTSRWCFSRLPLPTSRCERNEETKRRGRSLQCQISTLYLIISFFFFFFKKI